MSRITLRLDGATADEAAAFVSAFQRTTDYGLPANRVDKPIVEMIGIGWTITTPALRRDRVTALVELLAKSAPVERATEHQPRAALLPLSAPCPCCDHTISRHFLRNEPGHVGCNVDGCTCTQAGNTPVP